MLIYLKFFLTIIVVTCISLNVVAHNFSRVSGYYIEKPLDVVVRKGDIYVSVMNKKVKFSRDEIKATVERYRSQLPENHALFEEAKRWYNMTRSLLEER